MQVDTLVYENGAWAQATKNLTPESDAQIVFVFSDSDALTNPGILTSLKSLYPSAEIVGASSAGNILGADPITRSAVATAISFDHGSVDVSYVDFVADDNPQSAVQQLLEPLNRPELKHIFLLSSGLDTNGSELIGCVNAVGLPVPVTGGVAGSFDPSIETQTVIGDSVASNRLIAVGFYGESLSIYSGCQSGWSAFGADRVVTKAVANQVFELDGEPALDLYKRYLGEFVDELPASGRRFPLSIRAEKEGDAEIIRTVLDVDEATKSVIFAGHVPTGYIARLMKHDLNALVAGAASAALSIHKKNEKQAFALAVSCYGRLAVIDQLVEEELEAMESVLGPTVQLTGFYSFGEVAPLPGAGNECQFHNQTMTLTVIYED